MQAKQWTVQIYITEDNTDTTARAVLATRDRTHLEGHGRARRNPADRPVAEIGDELAAARALADLGTKLADVAAVDVAQFTGQ